MVDRVLRVLGQPKAKSWGYVIVACLLSFAAGNALRTNEAIDGSSKWWQQYCHQQVKGHVALQEKLDNQ